MSKLLLLHILVIILVNHLSASLLDNDLQSKVVPMENTEAGDLK